MIASRTFARRACGLFLASTAFLGAGANAQDTSEARQPAATQQSTDDEVIVVTATKRAENLQDVPIAITAITTKTLDDLQVNDFNDYARLVPSLSSKAGGGGGSAEGPGTNKVYFRGVASGENANHCASLPSVGTYLD
jgi:outer membrane receptor protein involved in Fe transport